MEFNGLTSDVLKNFGGVVRNNLNDLLNNVDDLDNAISIALESLD